MQIVNVEIDDFKFYCPVTGRQILDSEWFEPSPATVMTYLDDEREIMYANEEMLPKLSSMGLSVDESAEPEQLDALGMEDNIVCYKVTIWGPACGPTSSTVRIFIDMNYDNSKADGGEEES